MQSQSAGQVWRGTVSAVTSEGLAWCVIPALMGSELVGPMASHGAVEQDDSVLVVLLGGSRQDMIALPDYEPRFTLLESRLAALEQ